ncbi:1844_t:CDS:2 [Funneliformis geosporum]|uniref:1844_t:CDS:1 n=1 Tax=Funneliformis geosporum TaxID=1117311 RepID=A0A9W4SID8_9GLOM|nr:1844_t:CDS:2 [Funneliformis geosporum]
MNISRCDYSLYSGTFWEIKIQRNGIWDVSSIGNFALQPPWTNVIDDATSFDLFLVVTIPLICIGSGSLVG